MLQDSPGSVVEEFQPKLISAGLEQPEEVVKPAKLVEECVLPPQAPPGEPGQLNDPLPFAPPLVAIPAADPPAADVRKDVPHLRSPMDFRTSCTSLLGDERIGGLFLGFGEGLLKLFEKKKLMAPAVEELLFANEGSKGPQTWIQLETYHDADKAASDVQPTLVRQSSQSSVYSGTDAALHARAPRVRYDEAGGSVSVPGDIFFSAVCSGITSEAVTLDALAICPGDAVLVGRLVALSLNTHRLLSSPAFVASRGLPVGVFGAAVRKHFPNFHQGFLENVLHMDKASLKVLPAMGRQGADSVSCAAVRVCLSAPLNLARMHKVYPEMADIFEKVGSLQVTVLDEEESRCAMEVRLLKSKEFETEFTVCGEEYVWTDGQAQADVLLGTDGQPLICPFDPSGLASFRIRVDVALRLWMLGCSNLQIPSVVMSFDYKGSQFEDGAAGPNWRDTTYLRQAEYSAKLQTRICRFGKMPAFSRLARPILNVERLLALFVENLEVDVNVHPVSVSGAKADAARPSPLTRRGRPVPVWHFELSAKLSLPRMGSVARSCSFCLRRFVRKKVEAADAFKFWGDAFLNFGKDLARDRQVRK